MTSKELWIHTGVAQEALLDELIKIGQAMPGPTSPDVLTPWPDVPDEYVKLTPKEKRQLAKVNPAQFALGVALASGLGAGAGYGAAQLYNLAHRRIWGKTITPRHKAIAATVGSLLGLGAMGLHQAAELKKGLLYKKWMKARYGLTGKDAVRRG